MFTKLAMLWKETIVSLGWAGHVVQLIQNGLVGMEIQWTLDRLYIYAVIREPIACHWQSSWEPFVYCKPPLLQPRCTKYLSTGSNLTIALGRELFDTFTVGKASLEAERRRRMRMLIFILWSVALCLRTQSFSTGRLYQTRAHTLELGAHITPHWWATEVGRGVCVIPRLSHLIIHSTVSSSILHLSKPDSTGGGSLLRRSMLLRRQVSTGQLLGTGLLIRGAGAALHMAGKTDIADLYPLQWCRGSHHTCPPRSVTSQRMINKFCIRSFHWEGIHPVEGNSLMNETINSSQI